MTHVQAVRLARQRCIRLHADINVPESTSARSATASSLVAILLLVGANDSDAAVMMMGDSAVETKRGRWFRLLLTRPQATVSAGVKMCVRRSSAIYNAGRLNYQDEGSVGSGAGPSALDTADLLSNT